MTSLIIDVAQDVTSKISAIKTSGIKTVFCYLSSINPTGPKCWTVARVKAAAAAGLRIGLVHEGWGGVAGRGISAADGVRDGAYCRKRAGELGAPKDTCVYFACDRDFSATEIRTRIIPYFQAIRKAFADGFYRIGIYGSGAVCAATRALNLADLSWEAGSKGWTGYAAWEAKADMVQTVDANVGGVPDDSDIAHGDIGDYVPSFTVGAPLTAAPPAAADRHTPTPAQINAGFIAARARINAIAGSWSSWISDDAVRQVVTETLIAADQA